MYGRCKLIFIKSLNTLSEKYRKEIKKAVDELQAGNVIVIPTDTFYGLASNALDQESVEKVFKIKNRSPFNPVPVLISNLQQAETYGASFDRIEKKVADKFWPGPLTLVLRTDFDFPVGLVKKDGLVGFRIPKLKFTRQLIDEIGFPIIGTSANVSGEPETKNLKEVMQALQARGLSSYIDIKCGTAIRSSSVIQISEGLVKVLRSGAISKSKIETVI